MRDKAARTDAGGEIEYWKLDRGSSISKHVHEDDSTAKSDARDAGKGGSITVRGRGKIERDVREGREAR